MKEEEVIIIKESLKKYVEDIIFPRYELELFIKSSLSDFLLKEYKYVKYTDKGLETILKEATDTFMNRYVNMKLSINTIAYMINQNQSNLIDCISDKTWQLNTKLK